MTKFFHCLLLLFQIRRIIEKCKAEISAHLFVRSNREVVAFEFPLGRTTDRALKSVRIEDVESVSHEDSSSTFFTGRNTEITAVVVEVLSLAPLVKHQREDSLF